MHFSPLFGSAHLPVLLTPAADASKATLCAYVKQHRAELDQLRVRHGGLLLRGFALRTPEDFAALVSCFGARAASYVGGNSPRTHLAKNVYTSTEYPASEHISLHQEQSYLPHWPKRLFFFCQHAAQEGGQTSLAHAGDVTRALPAAIKDAFRSRRLDYVRHFHADAALGKSWQSTYGTDERERIDAIVAAQGGRCAWLDDGGLRVNTTLDAFAAHGESGQEVWFNQAEQWHPSAFAPQLRAMLERSYGSYGSAGLAHHCTHADGSALDEDMLAEVRATLAAHTLLFDWQQGDLLVIDNVLMMHGRRPFKGARTTLAYLSHT